MKQSSMSYKTIQFIIFFYFLIGLKSSLPEDYKKVGKTTYKSVTDEFEIYKTAVNNESGNFNVSEIYTSDGLTMVILKKLLSIY